MSRIVLNTIGVAHFPQHFDIIIGPLFQTLRLKELALLIEGFQLRFKFRLNFTNRLFHVVIIGHKVSGRKNCQMFDFSKHMSCQRLNLTYPLNLIAEKFNTKGILIPRGWENFDDIATHAEFTTLEVNVIALKLNIYQTIEQVISCDFKSRPQADHIISVFLGIPQAVNTADRCHDNDIIAF